jgi:sporulation protein YlmC with PRC-barrel domain
MNSLSTHKILASTLLVAATLTAPVIASAVDAQGASLSLVSPADLNQIIAGWSVKKDILGKTVVNEKNEKIGTVEDVIVTPDKNISYAVIAAGGFLGVGSHDVAIAVQYFHRNGEKVVLNGATKELLKGIPAFKYK